MNKIEYSSERQEDSCKNCKTLQNQFCYKQQELLHLKEGHRRLQQVLAEKGAELSHAIRRAEINEREYPGLIVESVTSGWDTPSCAAVLAQLGLRSFCPEPVR